MAQKNNLIASSVKERVSDKYHFKVSNQLPFALLESKYPEFLSPHPLTLMAGRVPNELLLGTIALYQNQAVGLIVVEKCNAKEGLIICWHVLNAHRGIGLGKMLMTRMEHFAASQKLQTLSLSYREDSPFYLPIIKTTHRFHWESPNKALMLYKFSAEKFMQLAWIPKIRLPRQYQIFSWSDLTNTEKQQIITRHQQRNWYPLDQAPIFDSANMEPANSLGLSFQNKIVGWIITHRVHDDIIEYSSLFVSPELRFSRGYPLIVEAIRRQYELGIGRGIFQVQTQNRAMISFVEKRVKPCITYQTARIISKKIM